MSLAAPMHLASGSMAAGTRAEHPRLLAVTLAASVVIHLVLIAVAPGIPRPGDATVRPLEVFLRPPVAHPMRAEPPPPRKPERVVVKPELHVPRPLPVKSQPPQPRPAVLALPDAAAPVQPSFTVPQPSVEPGPPVPETKPKAIAATPSPPAPPKETVATTEPVYNAAYLGNAKPRYPLIARRNGVEGTVLIKVLISREGRAAQVQLERTSGSSALDGAALDAVKDWRFTPGRRGQENVEMWHIVPVIFKLEAAS